VFVIFVNVYYFNQRYVNAKKLRQIARVNSEPETDWLRRVDIYKTLTPRLSLRFVL